MVGVRRANRATSADERCVLAAVASSSEDGLALRLGECPLRIPLDDGRPGVPHHGDADGYDPEEGDEVEVVHHPASGLWMPETSHRPSIFSIDRSTMVGTCSVSTGSATPPVTEPSQ